MTKAETALEILERRMEEIRADYRNRPITRRLLENLLSEALEEAIRVRQAGLVDRLHVAVRRARDSSHAIEVWIGEIDHPERPEWTRSKIAVVHGETN